MTIWRQEFNHWSAREEYIVPVYKSKCLSFIKDMKVKNYPLMDQVRQFVNIIGLENVFAINEYIDSQYYPVIVVFYKAETPITFKYDPLKCQIKSSKSS